MVGNTEEKTGYFRRQGLRATLNESRRQKVKRRSPFSLGGGFPPSSSYSRRSQCLFGGGGYCVSKARRGKRRKGTLPPFSLYALPPPKKSREVTFSTFPFPPIKKVTRADTLSSPPSPTGGEVILRVVPQQRDECGSGWVG